MTEQVIKLVKDIEQLEFDLSLCSVDRHQIKMDFIREQLERKIRVLKILTNFKDEA